MKTLISVLLVLASFQTHATGTSVASGTGGAGTASVEASDTPYLNPASLAYLTGYYFTTFYGVAKPRNTGKVQDFGVSITENMRETMVPTSIAYAESAFEGETTAKDVVARDFRLSFGNFIKEKYAFGLSITHKDNQFLEERLSETNANMGLLFAPNKNMGFALFAESLVPPTNKRIPEFYRRQQTTTLGFSYNYKKMARFKADIKSATNNTYSKPILMIGMENYLNKWLVIRVGAQQDNELEGNTYSGGLGFIGPKFGLHYAYQSIRVNKPIEDNSSRHSVDLAIPIW